MTALATTARRRPAPAPRPVPEPAPLWQEHGWALGIETVAAIVGAVVILSMVFA